MARYWFRQKTFGYGATPNTWQGWLFTAVFIALVFGVEHFVPQIANLPLRRIVAVGSPFVLLIPFIWIIALKTEGGRWRWHWGDED